MAGRIEAWGARRRREAGLGLGGLAILLIVIGVAVWTIVQVRRSPEARFAAPRSEFSTPEGTFHAFLAARQAYQGKRSDPIDDILACMTADDARWFRENKRFVAQESQFGMAALVGSDKEQSVMALDVLLGGAPKNQGAPVAKTFVKGDKAVLYFPSGSSKLASARLIREGTNWKIVDWFGMRWGEIAETWIYGRMNMGLPITTLENDWIYADGEEQYLELVRAFHEEVGAPPPDDAPEGLAPAEQRTDAVTAQSFLASYAQNAAAFAGGAAGVDEVLAFHSADDRNWFERYWRDIAAAAGAGAGREDAMRAILPYGPTSPQARLDDLKTAGSRALASFHEARPGGETQIKVCLIKEEGQWRIVTFFYSRHLHWMPAILQAKAERGEALASDELDYQQNGRRRFERAMQEFYLAVGEAIP